MRLLITGRTGFVGTWLQRITAVEGVASRYAILTTDAGDILDRERLAEAVAVARPQAVIHLAAQSSVPASIADPLATVQVNVMGTLNLLDALERSGFTGRFLFVGSGDEYGIVTPEGLPVPESAPLQPRNPYAASKAAAEMLVIERCRRGRIDAVCARAFNHTGPDQDVRFVLPALARQIVLIAAGHQPPVIVTGDLDVTRDFLDVRDVVGAYLCLLERGESGGVYNVCSGIERHLGETVAAMLAMAGVDATVERAPHLMRPAEQRRSCGDNRRLIALGWHPVLSWNDTLADVLGYWRQRI